MAWVKIDDHFDEHPKHAQVGPVGWGVWLAGLAYCNRNLTDGFIPVSVAEAIGGKWRVRVEQEDGRIQVWQMGRSCGASGDDLDGEWVTSLLVQAKLWEVVDGGYLIHDYHEYQPSKEDLQRQYEQKSSAGAKGGKASAKARAQAPAQAESKHVLEQNSSTWSSTTQAESKPDPVPDPVPDPSGEADSSSLRSELVDGAAADLAATDTGEPAAITPEQVGEVWNEACGDLLPKVVKVSGQRRVHVKARIASSRERRSTEWWVVYFGRIRASPFLTGQVGRRPFHATFDWATESERNVLKVLEGNYDEREPDAGQGTEAPEPAGFAAIRDYERMRQAGGAMT